MMSDTKFLPVTERNTHAIIEQIQLDRRRMDEIEAKAAKLEKQVRALTIENVKLNERVTFLQAEVARWQ